MWPFRALFILFCLGALAAGFYKIQNRSLIAKDDPSMNVYDIAEKLPWLNVARPLTSKDLKGKIVLLDFWTYCCINCMHILPDLKKLEREFRNELVVIGVHSAKFQNEKDSDNIREAILRYQIEHPVVNDSDFILWRAFDIHAWPSFALLDAKGSFRGSTSGEGQYSALKEAIQSLIEEAKSQKTLGDQKIPIRVESPPGSLLSFPGKLAYDETHDRFWVSDSNHHRLIRFDRKGRADIVVGSGTQGSLDGELNLAQFNQPQGVVVDGDFVFVADTSNHLVRAIDLKSKTVKTIAGTGVQGYNRDPRGDALKIPLASPWDLALWTVNDRKILAIAMAGTHQIWAYDLKSKTIERLAGSGREDIEDGTASAAALAQTSGLSAYGDSLYFADSETSSVRFYKDGRVTTLIGKGLFEFGFINGPLEKARLQHPLGVSATKDELYIADTYNHAIRKIDLKTRTAETVVSTELKEPNDVLVVGNSLWIADTNHHSIKTFDLKSKKLTELKLKIDESPQQANNHLSTLPFLPNVQDLAEMKGGLVDHSKFFAVVMVRLPKGNKINQLAPSSWSLYSKNSVGYELIDSGSLKETKFNITANGALNSKDLVFDATIYHCPEHESKVSACAISSFRAPLRAEAGALTIQLQAK